MDEYFAGLMSFWATKSADLFYIGIGGRLRGNIARQNEVYPYCVFTQIDGLPEYFQDANYDELAYIEIQLDIFATTNFEVLALEKKARALFDHSNFTVSGWSHLAFTRFRNMLVPIDADEALEVDNQVHRYLLQYKSTLQKTRA